MRRPHPYSFFISFNWPSAPQRVTCFYSAASTPQNFGVIGLRHHSAIHNPACGGLLDNVQGATAVQGVTETEILPVFQQVMVGGDLSLQLDLDTQQGLMLLVWCCPSVQVCDSSDSRCSRTPLSCSVCIM